MRRRFMLSLILLGVCGSVGAQQSPIARVSVTPETVNVGESAELRVTVLVPTWFPRPPVYPAFELANALTRLPADSSYPVSERIDGETWSGITRNYRVLPLMAGTFRISDETIKVTFANPGATPIAMDVPVPEIVFRGSVPVGAETLDPYIAGRSLTLNLNMEGDTDALSAGDALSVTYVAELDGSPAMFLPPLAPELRFEGVSVYADEPEVQDTAPARRREKLTLVFNTGGEFAVPGVTLEFWNTESGAVETAAVEGIKVLVAGPPAAPAEPEPVGAPSWRRVITMLIGLVAVALLGWRASAVLIDRYRVAAARRRQTEAYAFQALRKALKTRSSAVVYHSLLAWISRLDEQTDTRCFALEFGDKSLHDAVDALSRAVYKDGDDMIDFRRLAVGLSQARARYVKALSRSVRSALPPLNP